MKAEGRGEAPSAAGASAADGVAVATACDVGNLEDKVPDLLDTDASDDSRKRSRKFGEMVREKLVREELLEVRGATRCCAMKRRVVVK